jgi:predicted DNA-binding transcriptional regulator YafY
MPASNMANTFDRIWQLLEILPSDAPGATASELTRVGNEEYGWAVTKRTVERYLIALFDAGLTRTVEGRDERRRENETQHWVADSTRNLHTARLGTPDALALHLIERVADSLLPPEIVAVLRKRMDSARSHLNRVRKLDRSAAWANKVAVLPEGFSLRPPPLDEEILGTLQRALLSEQQVQCTYQTTERSDVKHYPLEPRALILRGSVLYVVATRPDKPTKATAWYRVHRFKSATILEKKVSASEFQLSAFLENGGAEFGAKAKRIQFQAWVSVRLAEKLAETPLSDDMTLRPGQGGAIVKASLWQSWLFESWILSRGPDLRVLEPKGLRDVTAERLRTAAAAYR